MTSVCQWILRYDSKITSNKRKKYTGQTSSKLKKKKTFCTSKGITKRAKKIHRMGEKYLQIVSKLSRALQGPPGYKSLYFP